MSARLSERQIWKIVLAVLLIPAIAVTGFLGMIFTSLAGGERFYTPLVFLVALGLILFILLSFIKRLRSSWYWFSFLAFILLCGGAIGIHEMKQAYRDSFAVMNAEVDLYQYMPFEPQSKAVKLAERPTLHLDDQLPRLDGATALYPLYASFAQAVYPNRQYDLYDSEVMCSTTPDAYRRLFNGEADLIFVGPPSEEQLYEAKRRGIELKLTPIGKEAFVFFVQKDNPVTNVTLEQLKGIYSGEIRNWQGVGGKNAKIRAFQRPANSGSQTMLERIMEGTPLMQPPKEDIPSRMGEIISQTADYRNYPNAIGYSFLFYATQMVSNGDIKLLQIDGVAPEHSTIADGSYPLAMEWYAVTAGSSNPNVEKLLAWIRSEQGQQLVQQTGYTPILAP